ncbi:5-hydroxytryptamine receptor 7-like [Antedon mediterranea]|uniref:5-hydroxytryptamine receptor 7-like n=1 Tax=Antedon mediterranea TaxID=105859 RepID=UPI003AF497D4
MDYSTDTNTTAPSGLPEGVLIVEFVILLLLILCTIVGNCLVILSVWLERKLRSPSNYLYVNLAVADMAVAILVMPIALVTQVTGQWLLTDAICDVWIFLDIVCCTASILNLCMISVDRYLVITRPMQYCKRRTCKFMAIIVMCVWIVAIIITLPPLFGWGRNVHVDNNCLVSQSLGYTIYSTVGAFYGPLAVMLVLYYKIHKAARTAAAVEKRRLSIINNLVGANFAVKQTDEVLKLNANGSVKTSPEYVQSKRRKSTSIVGSLYRRKNSVMLKTSNSRESKATQTLGIIMGTFIVCWLPFFIVTLVRPYCDCNIQTWIQNLFLWLGYANSFLNPIIYPMFNRDFRKPYKRILSCRCSEMSYYKYMHEQRSTPRQNSESYLSEQCYRPNSRSGSSDASSL